MPWINTAELTPDGRASASSNRWLSNFENEQIYCGLDSMVALEVREELEKAFPESPGTYAFERALQAPYLDAMRRGWRVDEIARRQAAGAIRERMGLLERRLNQIALAVWDKPLNPRSPDQLKAFFYGAMHLPEVWISQKGVRKISTNREALEKLEIYLHARMPIACILGIRDLKKQLDIFETEVEEGRWYTSYNIAGTETGRPSSSRSAFGTGGNTQNIKSTLRYAFIADPGWKICAIDLEQVEARDVGFFCGSLFDDWSFLDACEHGDLHTNTSRLIWPELLWTGEPKADRELADQLFYRDFSYRDMAKRGAHLCLSSDHEVLTPQGWVNITAKPNIIMTWQPGKSKFAAVNCWTDEEYEGKMVNFEGNSISVLMTPNHRVPYKTDQRCQRINVRKAEDGPGLFMPLGEGYTGGEEKVPARLIAAFMADGRQKSTNRMEFHLLKHRKIERLNYLCDLYGYRLEIQNHDSYIVTGTLPKTAGAFMFNWTRECMDDFLDEYKYWDGHISATAVSLSSVNKEHLEWIQTFGRLCGIGGNINTSVVKSTFGGKSKEYVTTFHRLQQNNRQWANGKSVRWNVTEPSKQRVYCPTVPSEFFYVRRNGKVFVTGNTNYVGTAWTASRHLKVPIKVMEEFQRRYVLGDSAAFPCIPRFWRWVAEQLQTKQYLVTPFGRKRWFFGRPNDDTTLREAVANLPQSTTADRTNLGWWRIWKHMPQVQLLGQGFDSVIFQFPENLDENEVVSEALAHMRVELRALNGRSYVVPAEAKVGWNWGSEHTHNEKCEAAARKRGHASCPIRVNPEGLMKWSPARRDQRQRRVGLDRVAMSAGEL